MATIVVNITEAKKDLLRLIAELDAGNEVIIARRNTPVIRLDLTEPIENMGGDREA